MLADGVDLHDVGVLEPGDRLGLGPEPQPLGIGPAGPADDHLEGDEPVEPALPGLVDDAHPAVADLADDLVPRHVKVIGGRAGTEILTHAPFEAPFTGGVSVTAGGVAGGGGADVVTTSDEGGRPRVLVLGGGDLGLPPVANLLGPTPRASAAVGRCAAAGGG